MPPTGPGDEKTSSLSVDIFLDNNLQSVVKNTFVKHRGNRRLIPKDNLDFYITPSWVTRSLVNVTTLPPVCWEPAAGNGAIAKVLEEHGHRVVVSDIHDHGLPGVWIQDFLLLEQLPSGLEDCAVITNPPNNVSRQFCRHAIALGVAQVHMFMPVQALTGIKRYEQVYSSHPPQRVLLMTQRPTLYPGDAPVDHERMSGGAVDYAWFSWFRDGYDGPVLQWTPVGAREA